jgi:hypothetical protein
LDLKDGWFDEENNYFNKDGNISSPPPPYDENEDYCED